MRSALSLAAVATVLAIAPAVQAEEEAEPDAFVRVVVDSAELRTGPGVSYRVIATAHRGETFALEGRPGSGFWLRVLLPDGRTAYALGDEVQPFSVNDGEDGAPSRPGFFAPPPLEGARAGFAIVGGLLVIPEKDNQTHTYGYLEARPSLVLHKTVTLDAFIGDALTGDGSQLLYGAGATINLAPDWPICPFVGLAGGGLSVFPNSDSFVLKLEDLFLARAGGGFLLALRNRILVRVDGTNLTLFKADSYKNAQAVTIGLGVYF
jgi:hypothetical protein